MKKIVLGFSVFFGFCIFLSAAVLTVYGVHVVNSAIRLDEDAMAKWSQVENQYKRRYDLIPNIVATVKGYAKHEQETLTQVIEQRNKAMQVSVNLDDQNSLNNFLSMQDNLSNALSRLIAISERYPELKANTNFLDLQSQLEGTENRIAVARRDYIESVKKYNLVLRTIPSSWIISTFTELKTKPIFTIPEKEQETPQVVF